MKKAHGILLIKEDINFIFSFAVLTNDGKIVNFGDFLDYYDSMRDCMEKCVTIAKQNGYNIAYSEDFGARVYDIAVASYSHPFNFKKFYVAT